MAPVPDQFATEMIQLELELTRLETDYTQFFAGRLRRLPLQRRSRVDAAIRKYHRTPRRNTAERFRFEALQTRYVVLCQWWERTLRARDAGGDESEPG